MGSAQQTALKLTVSGCSQCVRVGIHRPLAANSSSSVQHLRFGFAFGAHQRPPNPTATLFGFATAFAIDLRQFLRHKITVHKTRSLSRRPALVVRQSGAILSNRVHRPSGTLNCSGGATQLLLFCGACCFPAAAAMQHAQCEQVGPAAVQ